MSNLQVCIGFAPKVQRIPINIPGRVLILEGDLILIEKKKKRKVCSFLVCDTCIYILVNSLFHAYRTHLIRAASRIEPPLKYKLVPLAQMKNKALS